MNGLSQDAKIKIIEYKFYQKPILDIYNNVSEEKALFDDEINKNQIYEYINSSNDIVDINNLSFYKLKNNLTEYNISYIDPSIKGLTEDDFFDYDLSTSIIHYNDLYNEPLICKYEKLKLQLDTGFLNKKNNYYKYYKLDGSSNNLLNKILYDNILTEYEKNILTNNTNIFSQKLYRKVGNELVELTGDTINTIIDIKTGYVEILNDTWIKNRATGEYFDYYISFYSYIGPLYKNLFNWNWDNDKKEFIYYKYHGNIGIHNKDPVEKVDVSGNLKLMDNRNFFRIQSNMVGYEKMYEMIHENSVYENKNKLIKTQTAVFNNIMVMKILKCQCTIENSLLLDENGHVYSFGNKNEGRLGLGFDYLYNNENVPVRISTNIKFNEIMHGSNHMLLISDNKELYGAGLTNYNQLSGFTYNIPKVDIKKIYLPNIKIDKIGCGLNHSVILDTSGVVWTCGDNTYGQLGYYRNENLINDNAIKNIYKELFKDNIILENQQLYNDIRQYLTELLIYDTNYSQIILTIREADMVGWISEKEIYISHSTNIINDDFTVLDIFKEILKKIVTIYDDFTVMEGITIDDDLTFIESILYNKSLSKL